MLIGAGTRAFIRAFECGPPRLTPFRGRRGSPVCQALPWPMILRRSPRAFHSIPPRCACGRGLSSTRQRHPLSHYPRSLQGPAGCGFWAKWALSVADVPPSLGRASGRSHAEQRLCSEPGMLCSGTATGGIFPGESRLEGVDESTRRADTKDAGISTTEADYTGRERGEGRDTA